MLFSPCRSLRLCGTGVTAELGSRTAKSNRANFLLCPFCSHEQGRGCQPRQDSFRFLRRQDFPSYSRCARIFQGGCTTFPGRTANPTLCTTIPAPFLSKREGQARKAVPSHPHFNLRGAEHWKLRQDFAGISDCVWQLGHTCC